MTKKNAPAKETCIIEFVTLGSALKVTAIDPETGREVSIVGDPKATRTELSHLAAAKLAHVLNKNAHTDNSKGPGILV